MDFSNALFRCHRLGDIMTPPREKAAKEKGELGETCKKYLRQYHRELKYGREKEIHSKYLDKGLMVEEDSITLYSRIKKQYFKKNEERLSNSYITGLPDLFIGKDIHNATHITDIKSSWDLFTFPYPSDGFDKDHWWQIQGYMALSGAETGSVVYCLINTPEVLINDEKRRLFYRMNVVSDQNDDYIKACEEIERSMMFDDIPIGERILEYHFERDNEAIAAMYNRIEKCREYMNTLETSYPKRIAA